MALVDELQAVIGETANLADLASVFDKINTMEAENEAFKVEIEKAKTENETLRKDNVALLMREFSRKEEAPIEEEKPQEKDIVDMTEEELDAYLNDKYKKG